MSNSYRGSVEEGKKKTNIRLDDIKTHITDKDHLINNIITQLKTQTLVDVNNDKSYKNFQKHMINSDIRTKLEERLTEYDEPLYSAQQLKQKNLEYAISNEKDKSSHDKFPNYTGKVDSFITPQKDGRSTGYIHSSRQTVKLIYEAVIEQKVFEGCITQYQGMNH